VGEIHQLMQFSCNLAAISAHSSPFSQRQWSRRTTNWPVSGWRRPSHRSLVFCRSTDLPTDRNTLPTDRSLRLRVGHGQPRSTCLLPVHTVPVLQEEGEAYVMKGMCLETGNLVGRGLVAQLEVVGSMLLCFSCVYVSCMFIPT
jgi:hypothetical protein